MNAMMRRWKKNMISVGSFKKLSWDLEKYIRSVSHALKTTKLNVISWGQSLLRTLSSLRVCSSIYGIIDMHHCLQNRSLSSLRAGVSGCVMQQSPVRRRQCQRQGCDPVRGCKLLLGRRVHEWTTCFSRLWINFGDMVFGIWFSGYVLYIRTIPSKKVPPPTCWKSDASRGEAFLLGAAAASRR